MRAVLLTYVFAIIVMIGVDAAWLSVMADKIYRPSIGDAMAKSFSPAPAVIFYLIYVFGLTALAVFPDWGAPARPALVAAARGAVFGLCAYATYDLTNQATLKQWSTTLTVTDMAWGTFLSGLAAFAAALLYAYLTVNSGEVGAKIR